MIDFKSTLKMSIVSLRVNKMRSMLTSLGIIMGVAAVIIMMAVSTGSSKKIKANIASMGSNLMTVRSASAKSGGVRQGMGSKPTLTIKDAEAIEKNVSGIDAISVVSTEGKQLTYGNQNWSTTVYGIMPQYFYIQNYEVESGRGLSFDDIRNTAKVTVIGSSVATELFGDLNPVGKIIRVGNIPFKVVGVLKSKGSSGMMNNDDLIFIPITTAQRKVFGTAFPGTVGMIMVKGEDSETLDETQREIEALLTTRHHIAKNQDRDFEVRNFAEVQEKIKSTVNIMATLLSAIASVALLVGGIGIMNIMLVSVTERTKEIGIRMAIGAKSSDILLQFLIESVILSLAGGLVGVIIGVVGTKFIEIMAAINEVDLVPSISLFSIVLSFGFSAMVGIGFGFYPAFKAAKLNPIDALRYE